MTDLQVALLLFGACGALVALPFIAGLALLVRKGLRDNAPEQRPRLVAEARAALDRHACALLPWGPSSLGDLSIARQIGYSQVTTTRVEGAILARSQDAPLVAFSAIVGAGLKLVLARTTAHEWELHIDPQGASIALALNGRPFGSYVRGGALRDAAGQPLGQVTDAPGPPLAGLASARYNAVTVRGRPIGRFVATTGLREAAQLVAGEHPPAVFPARTPLDPEAEAWLLGLTIAHLVYIDIVREARIARSRLRGRLHTSEVDNGRL